MDVSQAGEYLGGFSTNTLYGWVSQRRIPFIKIGGRLRFDRRKLDAWVEKKTFDPIED